MDFFRSVGNFFKGAFGGNDDDEEKRKRQQEQQRKQQEQQRQQTQKTEVPFKPPQQQQQPNIADMFQKKKDPVANTAVPILQQQATPKPVLNYQQLREKAVEYQQPKVQDVNNYYKNDLDVLNKELARGEQADTQRIQGVMQSLENRRKELKEFHKQRGDSDSFKSARDLQDTIKATRGDWTKENEELNRFWNSVGKEEKDDFLAFLNEQQGKGSDREWRRKENFTDKNVKVQVARQEQENEEISKQLMGEDYKDAPLSEFGDITFTQALDYFNKQNAQWRRNYILTLADLLEKGDEVPEEKRNQAALMYVLLSTRGSKDTNVGDTTTSFSATAADKIGGGFGRGVLRGIDYVVPGVDTLGTGKLREFADEWDERAIEDRKFLPDQKAADVGATVGSIVKGVGDLGLMITPVGKVDKFARATKLANTSNRAVNASTRILPGSAAGTGIDIVQEVGRGNEPDIVRSLGTGLAIDAAIDLAIGRVAPAKRGVQKLFGKNLDEAVDVGTGGTATATTAAARKQVIEETMDDALKVRESELRAIVDDVDMPSFQKQAARRELDEVVEAQVKANTPDDLPIDSPTFIFKRQISEIIETETAKLEDFVSQPGLTQQQIEQAVEETRKRTTEMIETLQANRRAGLDAVEGQAEGNAKQIGDVQEQGAEAAQKRAQAQQGSSGQPLPDPEAVANNPYDIDEASSSLDSMTDRVKDGVKTSDNLLFRLIQKAREVPVVGGESWRRGVDKARNFANDQFYNRGIASSNGATAAAARTPRTAFNFFGMKDADRMVKNTYDAGRSANSQRIQAHAKDLQDMFNNVPDVEETAKKLYQVLESPEMLARMYGENTPKLTVADLLPEEKLIFDRMTELNKVRNEIWWRIMIERRKAGLVDDEKFAQAYQNYNRFKDGMHSPRIYDFDLEDLGMTVRGNSNKGAYMKRKDVTEVDQSTIDKINANPVQSSLFRLQSGMDELQRINTINKLAEAGYLRDVPPNRNFIKLEGAQYGSANGKYMDKQIVGDLENSTGIFNTKAGQAANDLLDIYRDSIFGSLDRSIKKAKTVYSPGTFLGNLFSNPMFFNRGSGVNAVQQSYNMAREVPSLQGHLSGRKLDPDILEMQRQGVKIGYTGDELVGSKADFRVITDSGALQSVKDVATLPTKIYGGTDDLAKVSIYKTLRRRGVDPQTAALRAAQFTQDYGNTGRAVAMLADSPVLGQPFARFVPELIRLTKNNVLYNPVGTFAGLYGLAQVQNKLWEMSGETPEERRVRENAPGKVKIPFSGWVNSLAGGEGDISLDFPVGDSSINAARALGFNFPQEPGVDATTSLVKNLAPFAIPFMENPEGEMEFQPQQLVSSMLLRPLAEQVVNKDFMGRYVDDPNNKIRGTRADGDETKYSDETRAKTGNRLYHLFMNYSPMSNEADAIATATGLRDKITQPGVEDQGTDYYGKERTNAEALWRSLGVKVESNDQEARDKRMDIDVYFNEDLPETQKFLSDNPDLREAYWQLKSTSKDRNSLVRENKIITPEKWTIIKADSSGRLLNFLGSQDARVREKSIEENKQDPNKLIKPLDPIYELTPDKQKIVVDLRSKPTGDDEAEDILEATSAWYREFKKNVSDYYEGNTAYYDQLDIEANSKPNPRVQEYYDIKYPETPPLVEQYFNVKEQQGDDAAKAFSDAQGDALSEQFDAWGLQRLDYTNQKRAIEGYPPISEEVWNDRTYGFSPSGGGWGSGGGSKRPYQTNTLGRLPNFLQGVNRLDPVEAAKIPDLASLLRAAQAGSGGGRRKPPLGASARGE